MAATADESAIPNLPPTSWAVLGMLSYDEEISGYDLKKWADWSLRYFYWSPSYSQIYSELKKLEQHGFATSRVVNDNGMRGRRLYTITPAGRKAVIAWSTTTPVDEPVLKHHVMLRVLFGHLSTPDRLKEILREHMSNLDEIEKRAAIDAKGAESEPGWAFSRIVLQWAQRYYATERELVRQLIDEIDGAAETLEKAEHEVDVEYPTPTPGRWREVERAVQEGEV